MRIAAVVVAGGRGLRLGAGVPKQLLEIGGRSLLRRSLDPFDARPDVAEIVVVLPAELVAEGASLVAGVQTPCRVVAGGARRQDSVRAGVAALTPAADLVLIHDAARPFASAELIDRVVAAAIEHGAAIPALTVRDTVKRVDADGAIVETIARDELRLAQTPQGFHRALLDDAFAADAEQAVIAADQAVTAADQAASDDAMLVERLGRPVRVVPGDEGNIKITTMDDLAAARAIATPPRAGAGYDLHRLVDGRRLVRAGVELDDRRGPLGHSDGDVVCHAIVDALLGAAGAGDIGRHFPNTDPQWKDAAGLDLLGRAVAVIRAAGYRVTNVDVTVVLERPKLSPHADAIRARLAPVLGVAAGAVSVKAKTNEGVDAVGRGEAIAAHAVAMIAAAGDAS
jgi:2-C-methyl-D-erythritol 4-phosphate cytidylyltransferase/2-C-methyl-D-erythritol 2,4-cyclodiphosphate synthase